MCHDHAHRQWGNASLLTHSLKKPSRAPRFRSEDPDSCSGKHNSHTAWHPTLLSLRQSYSFTVTHCCCGGLHAHGVVSERHVQAAEAGLGVSMMERLQAAGVAVQLLKTQYRMHPLLASWPSSTFYGNQLLSHPVPADRRPPRGGLSAWPCMACPAYMPSVVCPAQHAQHTQHAFASGNLLWSAHSVAPKAC